MDLTAAMASTVDPTFLSLSLAVGGSAEPVAVMYDHIARPVSDETNLAAQTVIRRAGFRTCHQVFKIGVDDPRDWIGDHVEPDPEDRNPR